MKLKHQLLITFLAIGLIPTLITGYIASTVASNAIEKQAFSQLVAVREIKKNQLTAYFSDRKNDIEILATSIQRTLDFNSYDDLNFSAHNNHDYFEQFINTYGYYDLFLIDDSGEIFYTVTKEADYQTSLTTGKYSSSGLGQLFKRVLTNNSFGISDFSRYAPSNDDPAGFIAYPFTTPSGAKFVLALQLSIGKINDVMKERAGMGRSGESYLIGSDLLMRSDSFLDPKGHSVKASFAGNVQQNGVDTEAAKLSISGKTGNKIIIDYNGNPVLSAYTPLNIDGNRWALISEIDVAEALQPVTTLHWDIFIIIVVCIAAVVAVALLCSKSILKPLGGEPNEMRHISETIAEGNLTVVFNNGHEPESVYGAMNRMTNHLQSVVGDIIDSSNSLASVSEQTSALSLQSSLSLRNQQANIAQVATAVEEMSATINEVAHSAANVSHSAQLAQTSSNEASRKLTETITELGNLDNEINQASQVAQTLESGSHEIGSVLEVIRGIAEQTNLLALNAAIEAARAGEQGRGFAVVADEVRTLASKTQESTANIEIMISQLQNASNNAVTAMVKSGEVCKLTIINAQTTASSIEAVNTEIESITQMTEMIATSVEEQSCVSNEISKNVTEINDVADENSVTADEVSTASKDMNSIADTLNQLTIQFKTT
jgi:methyl-accepting chemotaxis protein